MFHVKHFCPVAAQNLTRLRTAVSCLCVRSADFLVQLESGRDGVALARPPAHGIPNVRCAKIFCLFLEASKSELQTNGAFDGGHIVMAQLPDPFPQAKLADRAELIGHGLSLLAV